MTHFSFVQIPEALEAVSTHAWLTPDGLVTSQPSNLPDIQSVLKQAEALVSQLRAMLNAYPGNRLIGERQH